MVFLSRIHVRYLHHMDLGHTRNKRRGAQKLRLDRVYRHVFSKTRDFYCIMDEKAYFLFSGSDVPQSDHYYTKANGLTDNCIKFRRQAKV